MRTGRPKRHGHAAGGIVSGTYRSWTELVRRTTNPKPQDAHVYKDRGITVCERWLVFDNFLHDMGERPLGTSIERKDNNKGYEPGNCKWASHQEQTSNRRTNKVTFDDAVEIIVRRLNNESINSIADRFGISKSSVSRITNGLQWPDAQIRARELYQKYKRK